MDRFRTIYFGDRDWRFGMKSGIHIGLAGREISFSMDLDPSDQRDTDMRAYLSMNKVPEPEVVHLMMRAVREGDIVVDGGANIGYFTLLLSRLVGPTGKVIAVEPSPPNLAKIRRNLEINQITNVEVVPKALWSESGKTLDFHLTEYGGYDSLTKTDRTVETIQVETVSLPELISFQVRLTKLDLEGSELEVLNCPRVFSDFIVVEVHDEAAPTIRSLLFEYGAYVLHSDGSLPSRIPNASRILPKAENSNLLFSTGPDVASVWPEVLY